MKDGKRKPRVLLSAYACEPGKGSEPGVGWNVARELAARVDLSVVTRANNRPVIEASGEDWIHRVDWIFWDPPRWLVFWKKGGRGVQLFYIIWQLGILKVARKELARKNFDIIHHITFGKYWIPSRLAGLGVPFVFGPVGGGETSPPGLDDRSLRGKCSELAKQLAIGLVRILRGARKLYRAAAWTFAATPHTRDAIESLGVSRVSVMPQSAIREQDIPHVNQLSSSAERTTLQLVSACRLIPWKAVDLSIEAVALASTSVSVHLTVLQDGPELQGLKNLARDLGIAERVTFKGRLPNLEAVYAEISKADAVIHPALHEAFGQACSNRSLWVSR